MAKALENFYQSKRIPTIINVNIRRKIKCEVNQLKKILKFKRKIKNNSQIEMENTFRSTLSNIFAIEQQAIVENSFMEIDNQIAEGKLKFYKTIFQSN